MHLALLLLLVRALVPAGFMPDLAALRDGRLQIVLCSTDGSRVLAVDQDGKPVDGSDRHDGAGALHCPFGLAAAQALILPGLPQLLVPRGVEQSHSPSSPHPALLPPVRGPPLGARAPPVPTV